VKKYLYDKGNFSEIREMLGGYDWANVLCGKSADDMWVAISSAILIAVENSVPHRCEVPGQSRRRRRPVWMNERALGKIRKKKEAFDRYKRTREGEDYLEYAKARNSVKSEVRKAVRDYEKEVAKQSKRNPKAFYKYVNSKLKTRSGIGNLRTETGKEVECDKDKADMFNNFFSSVYETEDVG